MRQSLEPSGYGIKRFQTRMAHMLTIIFGAGASYDSDPTNPSINHNSGRYSESSRPPLAKDLFDTRYGDFTRKYPQAQQLFPRLRNAAPDIEQELEKIKNESATYLPYNARLLSMRFYLRDVVSSSIQSWCNSFTDVTTYHHLLDIIDRWQNVNKKEVALVSFNYDTLLEKACSDVLGINFAKMSDYTENSTPYRIYKVHGSTDWFHQVENVQGSVFNSTEKLIWTNKFSKSSSTDSESVQFVPAIAIPTAQKSSFEFPGEHLTSLISDLHQTTDIISIGWRGAEEHFLKLLNDQSISLSNRRLMVVGIDPKNTGETSQKIKKDSPIPYGNLLESYKGFSGFVAADLAQFLGN
jgi:hypothetical protein